MLNTWYGRGLVVALLNILVIVVHYAIAYFIGIELQGSPWFAVVLLFTAVAATVFIWIRFARRWAAPFSRRFAFALLGSSFYWLSLLGILYITWWTGNPWAKIGGVIGSVLVGITACSCFLVLWLLSRKSS